MWLSSKPLQMAHFQRVIDTAHLVHFCAALYIRSMDTCVTPSAALSMVQHWIDSGCPSGTAGVLDSFGEWMRAVSGILENAGVEGFNDNRDIFLERADVSGDEDDEFVNRWYDLHGEEQQAPRTLLLLAEDVFTLVAKDERGRAKSLGHRLKKLVDRVFNVNGTPVAVRRVRTRSSTYFLERLQGAPPKERSAHVLRPTPPTP